MKTIQITLEHAKNIIEDTYVKTLFHDYMKANNIKPDEYTNNDIIVFLKNLGYSVTTNPEKVTMLNPCPEYIRYTGRNLQDVIKFVNGRNVFLSANGGYAKDSILISGIGVATPGDYIYKNIAYDHVPPVIISRSIFPRIICEDKPVNLPEKECPDIIAKMEDIIENIKDKHTVFGETETDIIIRALTEQIHTCTR